MAKLRELSTWPIENHDVLPALKQYLEENEVGIAMADLIAQASADIGRDLHDVMAGGKYFVSEKVYRAACDVYRPQLKKNYAGYFHRAGVAAIVFPALMFPTTPIGEAQEIGMSWKLRFIADSIHSALTSFSRTCKPLPV